jgi:hypothetical protein
MPTMRARLAPREFRPVVCIAGASTYKPLGMSSPACRQGNEANFMDAYWCARESAEAARST